MEKPEKWNAFVGCLCAVAVFFLSNLAIQKIGVNRAASFIGIAMVVSILMGVWVLGESFSLWPGLGAAVIIAGVYIANAGSVE